MKRNIAFLVIVVIACAFSSGCALTSMNHMAITNWVDRTLMPDDRTLQWVLTPVMVPVGAVTLAADNFIVAPAVSLHSAFLDLIDIWRKRVGGYFTEMGILPFRILLSPVQFFGDWFGRSFFAIKPREDAAWGWPKWGEQWVRDHEGKLLGPPDMYNPVTKEPVSP